MSTMTAQLLIGEAHPYDGGISPTHSIFLSLMPRGLLPQKFDRILGGR
jgi:hypothetical protein